MSHSNRLPRFARLAAQAALAFGVVVTLAGSATPAAAQGAWCANYSGRDGGATNCGFYTLGQCRAAVSGVGGFCSMSPYGGYGSYTYGNPYAAFTDQPLRRKKRRVYR